MAGAGIEQAGIGGVSYSGDAVGGVSDLAMGPGGNAYTGDSGAARGGRVVNDAEGGAITGSGTSAYSLPHLVNRREY